jgi:hypothetical protein
MNREKRIELEEYWEDVEEALEGAHLIAFDGCHKIYVAMDETEAEWFRNNYTPEVCETSRTYEGTVWGMLQKLREWWGESCPLRFIQAVEHNEEDPSAGYTRLIPQGADEEEYEEEDEDMYV